LKKCKEELISSQVPEIRRTWDGRHFELFGRGKGGEKTCSSPSGSGSKEKKILDSILGSLRVSNYLSESLGGVTGKRNTKRTEEGRGNIG